LASGWEGMWNRWHVRLADTASSGSGLENRACGAKEPRLLWKPIGQKWTEMDWKLAKNTEVIDGVGEDW